MSNSFTSSYSFLVVTIWCTCWVFPRSAPSICQILLLYSSDHPFSLLQLFVCYSFLWAGEVSSFAFCFPLLSVLVRLSLNSPHFVLTLAFLDCFVFLSMIFDQSSSNFFLIMCCLYLLECFFFNLSAIMYFRWSRACSFPFQEPNTTSFRTCHLLLFTPFSISSVSSAFL